MSKRPGQADVDQVDVEAIAAGAAGRFQVAPWLEALRLVARHYRLSLSMQAASNTARWDDAEQDAARLHNLARSLGLRIKVAEPDGFDLAASGWRLPLILELRNGQVAVVTGLSGAGEANVQLVGDEGLLTSLPVDDLMGAVRRIVIPRPARSAPDARVDAYIEPFDGHWLRRIVLRDLRPYVHILLASLLANALTLAGTLFSMQVYDRVVPAESYPTLYILFGGVLLAIAFDFIMRRLRTGITDLLGKRADLRMSDQVFGHALRVRNRVRPTSTGTFIAQLRDLEHVRELLTSTTVTAIADIPFFLMFLVVFWFLGGPLVLVPLGALLLLVAPGLLVQRKLRAHANESMRESSLRNAMLVEAVQGIEDIKMLQAEDRFQQQWNHFNAVTGESQLKLRALTNGLSVWTHNVQNGVFASVIFFGAPIVMAGDITTGTLVGLSVLGSRMMAPLAHVTQIMSRFQQARVAMRSLNQIMRMPVDHPERESRIHKPRIAGAYRFKSAVFRYGDDASPVALAVRELGIRPGEKIAVLGRNGAGKSTLLQALSGLLEPSSGEVLLDDIALRQIDPADVRRDIGLLTQNARLFHGTLRDNILLGAPHASEEEMLGVLAMVGADDLIKRLPRGLDHVVLEGGHGLSGGQKQALLLARLIVRQPSVVLLDEPTASMDETTERHFIARFRAWSAERTVIVATHRMRVLDLVDRMVVVENGTIIRDGAKSEVLGALQQRGRPASGGEEG
ncbi:type I secretion system permease/ATPase [Sphingobium aquiterrae]|uniref:type I secretion system permease/ATPase n=1 Tax=Sphingobium aquiterrae TaxID=2038656 RepID=UPI003019B91C